MFTVLIMKSAQDANSAVKDYAAEHGEQVLFQSRQAADSLAKELSESDTRVRIQQTAPQESRNIDAYLIPQPRRYISEPKKSKKDGLTFGVGPNQYGEVGEAVVTGEYGIAPGLKYYLRTKFDLPPADDSKITRGRHSIPESVEYTGSWHPDLVVDIMKTDGWEHLQSFYCEIKTGNASFERQQQEAMKSLARRVSVLKIRVDIDSLPDEYTLRVYEVTPDG